MKVKFLSIIVFFSLFCSNTINSIPKLVSIPGTPMLLLGSYIFYKNPNKNARTFLKSMGKGIIGVPLYCVIALENIFLPAIGQGCAVLTTPVLGIKSFDHWTKTWYNRTSSDMHRLADFLFAH